MNTIALLAKLRNKDVLYGAGIGLLALFFSFFRINYQSLWNDEAISVFFATSPSLSFIWEAVLKTDLHPPLYYSVLHFWQIVFGDSIVSVRGLSALFFVGSSVLIYYFAKTLFSSRKIAGLTTLVFVTNPFAVLYAQEVRSYSMLMFFLLLNSLFFYKKVYLGQAGKSFRPVYFLTALVLIYSNILSLFALFAQGLLVLFRRNKQLIKEFAFLYAGLFVLYIPALRVIASANEFDYSYYNTERFSIFMKAVVAYAGFVGARINILNGKREIYTLLITSLALYSGIFLVLLHSIKKANRFLIGFFTIAFLSVLVASHIKFPVPDPKYFFVAFPFFILLLGNTFALAKKHLLPVIFVVIMTFNGIFLYHFYFDKNYEKENWKSVVQQIETDFRQEKDRRAIVISPVADPHSTWTYYADEKLIPAVGANRYGSEEIARAMDEDKIDSYDILYVSRFIYHLYDPNDNIRQYIEEKGFVKTGEFKDTKVEFWRYDKKK